MGGPGSAWGESKAVRPLCHAVPPPRKRPPGLYLGHDGIGCTGTALGAPGAARGGRQLLPEGTAAAGVGGGHPHCQGHSLTGGRPQDPPHSPAARGQKWVSHLGAGASQGVRGGHRGCGHSAEGAGCHRSCEWLCGMGQLGCHCWGLGSAGAAWGAVREQGRALAASSEPPSPAWPQSPYKRLADAWQHPVPLLTGPVRAPPYLNCSFSTTKSRRRP